MLMKSWYIFGTISAVVSLTVTSYRIFASTLISILERIRVLYLISVCWPRTDQVSALVKVPMESCLETCLPLNFELLENLVLV